MKWISVKERLPECRKGEFIVAIMGSRHEQSGDPIEDAEIVILRASFGDWLSMDSCSRYYESPDIECAEWHNTFSYWMPWKDFGFPEDMVVKE